MDVIYKITINGKEYISVLGENVLNVLVGNGFVIPSECAGNGTCGKCKIEISGDLSPLSETEKSILTEDEIKSGIRLACQTTLHGDAVIRNFNTPVRYDIPSFIPEISDFDSEDGIGVAVDLGTTTVSAAFFDLKTGKPISVKSALNRQRIHGSDVISRINFASESDKNLSILQSEAMETVNNIILSSGIQVSDIKKMTIAGNTAMELIFAGISVESLGQYPYEPISKLGGYVSGASLGLVCRDASVYLLPCAGGFFGGDAIACMLAADFDKTDSPVLSVDLGTNGEIALTEDGKTFIGTSAAAGPAFEGGEIYCGTGSIDGAICKAEILDNIKNIITIGNKPPIGICGSGLIDLISLFRKTDSIDSSGTIKNGSDSLSVCRGIVLTQNDIREFQKAKAAVRAGIDILIKRISKPLEKVCLFGGFGTTIDIRSAVYSGLFPVGFEDISVSLGNGALHGASMILLSKKNLQRCIDICKNTEIINLDSAEEFEKTYLNNMSL